jgi:hypothetical protein
MTWFGKPWPSDRLRALVCEDENERAPTPIGASSCRWRRGPGLFSPQPATCLWCGEPIIEDDRGAH